MNASVSSPSIEEAKSILLRLVAERGADGIRLTHLGAEFSKASSVPFEQYARAISQLSDQPVPKTERKLRPFIENECSAEIELVADEVKNNPFARLKSDEQSDVLLRSVPLPKYKAALWSAFIRPLKPNHRRFINLGERTGYTDLEEERSCPEGWIEVPRDFIAELPSDAKVDARDIDSRIRRWSAAHDVDARALVQADLTSPKRSLRDLLDIVSSLPAEVAARWLIPADVLTYLDRR